MAKLILANQKISNFYGNNIARPYVVLTEDGYVDKDRVDAPRINDALIEWASKVSFEHGGDLLKPTYDGEKIPEARTDFQIFLTEKYNDILAANPGLLGGDRKVLLSVASTYWRDNLTPEERKYYKEKAAEEKAQVAARIAEEEISNPKFKSFRQQLQRYKKSVGSMLSAAKAQAGPLWKLQRRMNKQYKQLREEEEAGKQKPQQNEDEVQVSKKGSAAKPGRKGNKKVRRQPKQEEEEEQELEEYKTEESEEEVVATGAMADLNLKEMPSAGKRKVPAARDKAGSKAAKVVGLGTVRTSRNKGYARMDEEKAQQPQGTRKHLASREGASPPAAGNGAARLLQKLNQKTRDSQLYDGEYELPSSQNPTPPKAANGKSPATLPSRSSAGKRSRRNATAVPADVEMTVLSPYKKPRSASKRG